MRSNYILAPSDDMWEDSWTYGEWRQYLVRRPGGLTQCARVSSLPFFSQIIGFILLCVSLMPVAWTLTDLYVAQMFAWNRVVTLGLTGLLLMSWPLPLHRDGYRLMVAVGPMNKPKTRVFAHEDPSWGG